MSIDMEQIISISEVIKIEDPKLYKLHLGGKNEDGVNPLDEFVQDPKNWIGWNEWKGDRNDWTRDFIFSLIEFYPKKNAWLFGGIFKIKKEEHFILKTI